jgi:hypothetical protein
MVSRCFFPIIVIEDWLNDLLECLLIYDDSHLKRKVSDQILIISDTESKMSDMDNEEELIISPSNSDKDILQRPACSSETMNTTVDKGFKSSVVTDPSLVMKTRNHMSSRENYVEKRFREQDKLINALKRKRCDSCSNSAKQAKHSNPPARSCLKPKTKPA